MQADLFDQHKQLLVAADALLAGVRRLPPLPIHEITQLRIHFSNLVRAHLTDEHKQIIAPLIASGRIDELPGARAMIADIQRIHASYSGHVRTWTMQALDADREGYAQSIASMIDTLRRFTVREEAELYWPTLRLLNARGPKHG